MVYDTGIEQKELLCRCWEMSAFAVNIVVSGTSLYKEFLCSRCLTAALYVVSLLVVRFQQSYVDA